MTQALPEAEQRTTDAIGSGTGIDDNAAVEAIKAERQQANQVMTVVTLVLVLSIIYIDENILIRYHNTLSVVVYHSGRSIDSKGVILMFGSNESPLPSPRVSRVYSFRTAQTVSYLVFLT